MNVLIIYAHPWTGSFNHAILEAVQKGLSNAGHESDCIDLVKDGFNPVTSEKELSLYSKGESIDPLISQYQNKITNADYLVFIFPNWWGGMPAILKGFFDKVFLKNFAYKKEPAPGNGLLKTKGAALISTFDAQKIVYQTLFRPHIMKNIAFQMLKTNGVKSVKVFPLCHIQNIGDRKRKAFLKKIETFSEKLK